MASSSRSSSESRPAICLSIGAEIRRNLCRSAEVEWSPSSRMLQVENSGTRSPTANSPRRSPPGRVPLGVDPHRWAENAVLLSEGPQLSLERGPQRLNGCLEPASCEIVQLDVDLIVRVNRLHGSRINRQARFRVHRVLSKVEDVAPSHHAFHQQKRLIESVDNSDHREVLT